MANRTGWTRNQLLVAFNLYCQIPFGKMHSLNPDVVKYAQLIGRTPSALAMKLTNIASLDPAITSTGRKGLKKTSSADKAMWDEMQRDWSNFIIESNRAIIELGLGEIENASENQQDESYDYSGRNKTVLSNARIGQNFFRKAVLSAYDYRCCITGLSVPELLIASHIVPWCDDISNRLNPRNGLCLSMLHDKAFDIGIITITEDMTVLVSKKRNVNNDMFYTTALLDYNNKPIIIPEKFKPDINFLAYHREHIFIQ